ncbi:MAG: hypothetical protein IJQ21_07055 [Lachnospiraceae bacterium]|nr:hypothetical protein [Lachnospiraceae bacterium]
MKWGFQKKMLTVRELFGKMRTHSAACTVAAAGLAAVVCGVIVIRAVGGIAFDDGSEPVPSRDDEILSMMETDDAILMGQNEAMRLQLDTMFVSLQTLRENVSSGTRVIETIERSLHEMNGVDESARDKCREMNGTLAELEDMMADAFSEISEISALCADDAPYDAEKRKELAGRIGKLNAAMAKIVDRYATVSTDVASLTTRLRDYGAGASEYRKAVDVLQESLASGRSEVSGLSAQIGQMGEQIHGTQNSMLEQLNASIAQMNRLSEQIVTSNMTVEGLSGQVFGSNRTIEALSEQVQSSGLTVEALSEQVQSSGLTVEALGEQVMASGRSVGELSEQVLASNRSIGELSGQVLQTNQTVEELSGQVLASNRMVEELSGQVLASTQTINALAEQLDASTRTIDELNIQLGEAKAELGGLREQVSATNTSVETVAAEIAGQAKAAGEAQARGTGYITVTFELTTYTFDFSPYVANHAALTGRDIMVRNFSANAAGSSQYHMGISANINMDNAVYDPSTGRLTINDVYLMSPFLSSTGTVTFAVIGGIAR